MKVFADRMVFNSRNYGLAVLRYFWPARSVGGNEPAREQSSQRLNDRPAFELCLSDLHGRLLSQSLIGAWQRTDCLIM
jgi:hypothetical protein